MTSPGSDSCRHFGGPVPSNSTVDRPAGWGSWEDADRLRRWAFLQRTAQQRLAWLIEALEIAYQSGALRPQGPADLESEPRT